MNKIFNQITLSAAKEIAERNARDYSTAQGVPPFVLSDKYIEAERCWMFFNRDVSEDSLGLKWAYVVSKKGLYSMVQDLSDDHERLMEYLQALSDNFKKHDE